MSSEPPDKREEEWQAAEAYRRDRLAAESKKAGFGGKSFYCDWVTHNKENMIEDILKHGGTLEEAEAAYSKMLQAANEAHEDSPVPEITVKPFLDRTVKSIEEACKLLGIETRSGVVVGIAVEPGFGATQMPVLMTDVSMLRVSTMLLPFYWKASRLIAAGLPYFKLGRRSAAKFDPTQAAQIMAQNDLYKTWFHVIGSAAEDGNPYEEAPDSDLALQQEVCNSMLLFVMAHEFAHHALNHQAQEGVADSIRLELEADALARRISICAVRHHDGERSPLDISGVGAVLALGTLELITRAKSVLRGTYGINEEPSKTHPSFAARIRNLSVHDADISGVPEHFRDGLINSRKGALQIIEMIWAEIYPAFVVRHRQGVRPAEDAADKGEWLPFWPPAR